MRYLLACCCLLTATLAKAEVIDIDGAELARLVATGVPVIDVRTGAEWQESGIIPGSHPITFFDAQGKANPPAWLEKARAVAKPGDPVAVICRSGNRTKVVSQFLSGQAGYARVYNVKEGIKGWSREGRPLAPPPASLLAACQADRSC